MARLPSKSNPCGMFRGAALPWRGIASSWRRLVSHSLPEAAVSLVAAGVFGSLFIHVFRDVFSADIAAIVPRAALGAVTVVCLVIALTGSLMVRRAAQRDVTVGWLNFSILSGLDPKRARITEGFSLAILATIIGLVTGTLIILAGGGVLQQRPIAVVASSFEGLLSRLVSWIVSWLVSWLETSIIVATLGLCLATALASLRTQTPKDQRSPSISGRPTKLAISPRRFSLVSKHWRSPLLTMIRWRTGLMLRAPSSWAFWGASLLATGGMSVAAAAGIPSAFVAIFAWFAGWFAALPLIFQAAAEADSIHFEYALGITPHQVARSHAGTGLIVASVCAAVTIIAITVIAITITTITTTTGLAAAPGEIMATAAASAAMAPSLTPFLLWQVDVRRPVIQMLTTLMASLFLATAIIATKAAFVLWPVVIIFLAQHQDQRLQVEIK